MNNSYYFKKYYRISFKSPNVNNNEPIGQCSYSELPIVTILTGITSVALHFLWCVLTSHFHVLIYHQIVEN